MASVNRVILIGNITRDIEMRYTQTGTPVCTVGMAMNERIKKGDEWVDEAVFVDVTLWGKTAEVASRYCTKGSPLFVEGRLKLESWEKDGAKHSKLSVVGERIQLLGSKQGESGSGQKPQQFKSKPKTSQSAAASDIADDDIPF